MWVEIMTSSRLIQWTEEFSDDVTEEDIEDAWRDSLAQYASGGFEVIE
jgi:hypothetical protein